MEIECPSCTTNNKIEFGENILCSSCKKTFAGHSYKKFKKPLLSATTALLIGTFGGYKAEQYFNLYKRYPVGVEYELIDSCIHSSRELMSGYYQSEKTSICICSLEKTMSELGYEELVKNESIFLTRFRSNLAACR